MSVELQNVFDVMKSALGDSELDSIMHSISGKDQKPISKSMSRKKPGSDQVLSPTKSKPTASSTKEGKVLLEEMKKVSNILQPVLHYIFSLM